MSADLGPRRDAARTELAAKFGHAVELEHPRAWPPICCSLPPSLTVGRRRGEEGEGEEGEGEEKEEEGERQPGVGVGRVRGECRC